MSGLRVQRVSKSSPAAVRVRPPACPFLRLCALVYFLSDLFYECTAYCTRLKTREHLIY